MITDEIKSSMSEKEQGTDGEVKDVASQFNKAFKKLLEDYVKNVNSGSIRMNDSTDVDKLYSVWKDVNNLNDGSVAGKTPALNSGQENIIEANINVHVKKEENDDGTEKETKKIDLNDLENLDNSKVGKLMGQREKQMNNDNIKRDD